MIGMYAVADTMITVLLTENWIGCVPFLRLSCIYWMIQPIQTANAQAIKACGRSDIYLRLETTKKIIAPPRNIDSTIGTILFFTFKLTSTKASNRRKNKNISINIKDENNKSKIIFIFSNRLISIAHTSY